MKLKSKDYDLNTLFQYDLLREILLNLAEYQNDIHAEIMALKNNDKIQDMRLSKLEEKHDIIFNPSEFNINITNYESGKKDEEEKRNKDDDKKEKEAKNEEKEKDENKGEKKEEKKEEKDIFDADSKDDDDYDEEEKKKKASKFDKLLNNNTNTNNTTYNNVQNQSSPLDPDIVRDMLKIIRENTEKIENIQSELKKLFENQIKKSKDELKRDFNSQLLEYKSKYNILDNRINELDQKNSEQDKAIEDLSVKCSDFDVFNMFKDTGDGNVDMSKVLVKALEEKVFKKFELIDLRYKQESNEVIKIKKTMENIQPLIEKNERDINDLKDADQKLREDIDNLKELIEQNNKKYNDIIKEQENTINKKIDDFKKNIDKKIKNIDNDLNNKIKECLQSVKDIDTNKENINNSNNYYDKEMINSLEKKINDLRKKTNDLENSFKLYMNNSELEEIKKKIKDIKFDLDQKITKDSLKELYNLHLSDVDEISDLREQVSTIFDDLKRNIKSTTILTNKVESIIGNIMHIKEFKPAPQKQIIDFTKYVENSKLTDIIKNFNKKFDKLYEEIDSLRRDLTDLEIDCKDYEKKERVNRLEEEIYKNFNDIKGLGQKNKNEIYKSIKGLEVQIKTLDDEMKQRQEDANSWILAKQPYKCFNCASCEKQIKNEIPSDEFISWNRYPQKSEKSNNNRFGRGFSHMLQMMTYDFINNVDNNKEQYIPISEEFNPNMNNINKDNNIGNEKNNIINNNINNSQIIDNNNHKSLTKIAQIERSTSHIMNKLKRREMGKSSVPKNNGRLKLPKMIDNFNKKIKNEESMPNLDEEKKNINNNVSFNNKEKIPPNEIDSPRIIKITKKRVNQMIKNNNINSPNRIEDNTKNESDLNINSRQKNIENVNNSQFKNI